MYTTKNSREAVEQGYIVYRAESPVYLSYVNYLRDNDLPLISVRLKSVFSTVVVDLSTTTNRVFTKEEAERVNEALSMYNERKTKRRWSTAEEGGDYAYASWIRYDRWGWGNKNAKAQIVAESLVNILGIKEATT